MITKRMGVVLLVGACGTSEPEAPPTWQTLASEEPGALLAVWGRTSQDVWVVGSRPAVDAGPRVLHYDGSAWASIETGETNLDLWWVTGLDNRDVLFGGTGGTVLRYRDGQFERLPTPNAVGTIYGIWGPSADDFWAVGDAGTGGGVAWHYDGQAFTSMAIPDPVPAHVFKVHGQASDDVWMSCSDGSTLHWDGALTRVGTPSQDPLFSIITTPDLRVAVGGASGQGELFENATGDWQDSLFYVPVRWRGTATNGRDVAVVGEGGGAAMRNGSTWELLPRATTLNFHSAWLDDDHGLWAVGGVFDGGLSHGLLMHYGSETVAEVAQ